MDIKNGVLAEGKYGTGELIQYEDGRDLLIKVDKPFDFKTGFDIELLLGYRQSCKDINEFYGPRGRTKWGEERYKEIVKEVKEKNIPPFKIPIKNQGVSSSCTGQALSYYISVLNMIEMGKWVDISARDIYAYISLGEGVGAYLRDALKLSVDRGVGTEELVPSYHYEYVNGRQFITPYNESEYLVKPKETEELKRIRTALRAKEFRLVQYTNDQMEQMAWAQLLGFGCYFSVDGENNGTWSSEYPQPPKKRVWGHALYGANAKDREIGFPNSWGTVGVNGWQKLKQNYFDDGAVGVAWTLIDKDNIYNNMDVKKFIKDNDLNQVRNTDTGAYGVIYHGKLLLISNERAGLYMVDREARGLIGKGKTVNINGKQWNEIMDTGLIELF